MSKFLNVRRQLDQILGMVFFPDETQAIREISSAPGMMAFADTLFLYICARYSKGSGCIVELGSYKGLSTAHLALGVHHGNKSQRVVACDPHYLGSYAEFKDVLHRFHLESVVESKVMTSRECAVQFNEPIEILWIDADHSLTSVEEDFDLWNRFLVPGGIVAFHDYTRSGPWSVFKQQVLSAPSFCETGFLSNIAYASKGSCANPELFRKFRRMERIRGWFSQSSRLRSKLLRPP